jgi:hypothetical protein
MADSRHLPSKRFADRCKDVAARAPLDVATKDHTPSAPIGAGFVMVGDKRVFIRKFDAEHAWTGSRRRNQGGAIMGATSPRWSAIAPAARR